MTSPHRIAFIGLGAMGYPMAGHLTRAGHEVTVFNRTTARAEAWQGECGGHVAPTPAAAAKDQDAVMLCVGNDDDVREVTTGEHGALPSMREGALLIDHTTTSKALATSLAASASQSGVAFLDAPVSGGTNRRREWRANGDGGCRRGRLYGGTTATRVLRQKRSALGPVGAGQLTKMVNQICIAGLLQGLSEGIHFAERAGLDVTAAMEVIAQGAAQSWQMNNRAETMIRGEFDFGFAVDWMRKDLGIAIEAAQSVGAEVPVTQLVDNFYADVQDLGGHRWDTSSLIQRLRAGGANR